MLVVYLVRTEDDGENMDVADPPVKLRSEGLVGNGKLYF